MEQLKNSPDKFRDGSGFSKQARANFKQAMSEAVKVHQENISKSRDQFDALLDSSPFRAEMLEQGITTDQMLRSIGLDLEDVGGGKASSSPPSSKPDYNSMSLEELKALKKARGL